MTSTNGGQDMIYHRMVEAYQRESEECVKLSNALKERERTLTLLNQKYEETRKLKQQLEEDLHVNLQENRIMSETQTNLNLELGQIKNSVRDVLNRENEVKKLIEDLRTLKENFLVQNSKILDDSCQSRKCVSLAFI